MAELVFPDIFWKKEIRCDFPIGEIMKRNWAAQIQVLEDMRELCERHGIRYFAAYGTLLGAVRHHGFIPWDDDVDIMMLGEDYIRFLYYVKDELDSKYELLNPYTDPDWKMCFSRVNYRLRGFREEELKRFQNCPFPVGVDIFPFYYLPRDPEKEMRLLELLERIRNLRKVNHYATEEKRKGNEAEYRELSKLVAEHLMELEQMTGYRFQADRSLVNQLEGLFDLVCRFTTEEESDEAACPYNYPYEMPRVPKGIFDETVLLPFENISVPAPKDFHTMLVAQFDEHYMDFQRNTAGHDYPYFAKLFRDTKDEFELKDLSRKREKNGMDGGVISWTYSGRSQEGRAASGKCVVLYYTSVREMVIYGEYVVDKIRNVLQYFEDRQDSLELWWVPGSFELEDMPFHLVVPELMEDYRSLIAKYREKGFGICDESGDVKTAIEQADCFYGDEGFHSKVFRKLGKHVLIQDYHITGAEGEIHGEFENVRLDREASCRDGSLYAFASNLNGCFKAEEGKWIYKGLFEGEPPRAEGLFRTVISWGNREVLIPGNADAVFIYDERFENPHMISVKSTLMGGFQHQAKFADAVPHGKSLYLFGERYAYVVRLHLETGQLVWIDIPDNETHWLSRGALLHDDLVHIPSDDYAKLLEFNLRTERVSIRENFNREKIEAELQKKWELEPKLPEFKKVSGWESYRDDVFEWYAREDSPLLHEQEDWIGLADLTDYVIWKKKQGVVQT